MSATESKVFSFFFFKLATFFMNEIMLVAIFAILEPLGYVSMRRGGKGEKYTVNQIHMHNMA